MNEVAIDSVVEIIRKWDGIVSLELPACAYGTCSILPNVLAASEYTSDQGDHHQVCDVHVSVSTHT